MYLFGRVFEAGHSNILEDFIYVTHRAREYIAMMRANALIDLRIARPLRWLAGKSAELTDWSPISMGLVFEKLETLFERASEVWHASLNPPSPSPLL